MFSIDYPLESTVRSKEFMQTIQKAELLSEDKFDGITHKNAERLLGLSASKAQVSEGSV